MNELQAQTHGDPCPRCGGTDYYCADEVEMAFMQLNAMRRDLQTEAHRLRAATSERSGEQTVRNVLNSLLWLVDSPPHHGRGSAIRVTAYQLGETLAAYFRGELEDPPADGSPF